MYSSENRTVHEIMRRCLVEPERLMGFECRMTTATDTHLEYVILIAFSP